MSFMANMFRGELEASQVFPYPNVLNEVSGILRFTLPSHKRKKEEKPQFD